MPAIYSIFTRTEHFRNSFFPYSILQWNNLDYRIRNLPSICQFKRAILNFFRPKPSLSFQGNNQGLTFLTRLRVGFSHLREHKLRHGFVDTDDPFCTCCCNSIEDTEHYLLHCSNFSACRLSLFNDLRNIDVNLIPFNTSIMTLILLYGHPDFKHEVNCKIFDSVIKYIFSTNCFSGSLFE